MALSVSRPAACGLLLIDFGSRRTALAVLISCNHFSTFSQKTVLRRRGMNTGGQTSHTHKRIHKQEPTHSLLTHSSPHLVPSVLLKTGKVSISSALLFLSLLFFRLRSGAKQIFVNQSGVRSILMRYYDHLTSYFPFIF